MTENNNKIFKLAIPTIIENILQILLGTVDTYFVSVLGSIAISAVGINSLISNLYLTFFIAISTGTSIFTARAHGENNAIKKNKIIINSLVIATFLGLATFSINILFGKHIVNIIVKDKVLAFESIIYFKAVIVPIFFLCFMTVLSSVIKSLGDVKSPLYTALFINIINLVLDYVLIIGIGDFNGIGILGAGIATTFSRMVGSVMLLIILNKKTRFLKFKNFKICMGIIRPMLNYGIPIGIEKLVMRTGQIIYGGLIVNIGITHYTAHNIAGTIEAYSYLPGVGFGVASFALIGHSIGKKDFKDIRIIGNNSFYFSSLLMVFIGMIFFIFAPFLAGMFTEDLEVIRLVTVVLRIIAVFQPFLCSTQVITSSLQAIGDVKFPLYLTFFGIWGIRLMGTYILGIELELGLVGVWISYTLDIVFRGTILFIRFNKKTRFLDTLEGKIINERS